MEITKGFGCKNDEKELIAALDDIFFSEEPHNNFMDLLPKLYKDKFNCGERNMILKEDGVIKAAIGCFPLEAVAAGRKMKIMGIGNVGVAKDCRRKGYMIELMNDVIAWMIDEGYDYSILGGQRQRYEYFGYAPSGSALHFEINVGNISRLRNGNTETTFTAREITEKDTELFAKINEFNEAQPYYVVRNEEDMLDILRSWRSTPYAVYDGDCFKGYFTTNCKGHFSEFKVVNVDDLLDFFLCAMKTTECESIAFTAPVYDTALCSYMQKICCGMSVCHVEQTNILNYAKFIEGFLAVKAQRMNLCSGTLNVLVHGYKKDEKLAITVDGKNVTVTETDADPDFELDHLEATAFFAGQYSEKRLSAPSFTQNWFPVDFYAGQQDNV